MNDLFLMEEDTEERQQFNQTTSLFGNNPLIQTAHALRMYSIMGPKSYAISYAMKCAIMHNEIMKANAKLSAIRDAAEMVATDLENSVGNKKTMAKCLRDALAV